MITAPDSGWLRIVLVRAILGIDKQNQARRMLTKKLIILVVIFTSFLGAAFHR